MSRTTGTARAALTLTALTLTALAGLISAPAQAQDAKVSKPGAYHGYATASYDGDQRTSFYIPMRDGVNLAVDLFRPTKGGAVATEKLPVVWMHTPYNRRTYSRGAATADAYPGYARQLVKYGYNVAVVDFRGLYASYGHNKGYNRGQWRDEARNDAYDVTEWFAAQPWSSGKIGMWGCSATGGSQMQALSNPSPHLKAIIPMSAEFDAYSFGVLGGVSRGPVGAGGGPPTDGNAERDAVAAPVDGPDGAARMAAAIAQHKGNIDSPGNVPFRDSPSDIVGGKPWWELTSAASYLAKMKASGVGVYDVATWDEAGTRHGPFFTFNNLGSKQARLLVGPGTHCNWTYVKQETGFDLVTEELRFYDYWLKGAPNGIMTQPAVTYYTYNAPPEKAWRQAAAFPLKSEVRTPFYIRREGLVRKAPPASSMDAVAMSAPAASASTVIKLAEGGMKYETPALTADLEVTGYPIAHLWVSTTAGDTDVMAQIDDVAPDGATRSYQMLGRLRASHRALAKPVFNNLGLPFHTHNKADATPLPNGKPTELTFDLLPMSYVFKAGHKVRVTFTFNDPENRPKPPGVTIMSGATTPSRIDLPVIPG